MLSLLNDSYTADEMLAHYKALYEKELDGLRSKLKECNYDPRMVG